MRTPLIAGNWKMNTDSSTAKGLAAAVGTRAVEAADVELLVCPPSIYLTLVRDALGNARVGLGAQDMYHEPAGAFTGETSGAMFTNDELRFKARLMTYRFSSTYDCAPVSDFRPMHKSNV